MFDTAKKLSHAGVITNFLLYLTGKGGLSSFPNFDVSTWEECVCGAFGMGNENVSVADCKTTNKIMEFFIHVGYCLRCLTGIGRR